MEKLRKIYKTTCDFLVWLIEPTHSQEKQCNLSLDEDANFSSLRHKLTQNMLLIIIGTLATILIGLAGLVASHGHRSTSIWLFYFSAVLYGFIAFKAWDDSAIPAVNHQADAELRAWVMVKAIGLVRPLAIGEKPNVVVEFYNGGKTPALKVQIIAVTYSRDELFPPPYFVPNPNMRIASEGVLGPAISMTSEAYINEPLSNQNQINAIANGSYKLYCVGVVNYQDISHRSRKTTFCYQISGVNLVGRAFGACDRGNDAD